MIGEASAPFWALGAVAAVAAVGAAVALRARSRSYPLPIAWGLFAVYVAQRTDKPAVALAAAAAAAAMLLTSAVVAFKVRRPG
jgi:hypothetical protein